MSDLLTVKEFADLIRQHPMSVYRRIRLHQQPGVRRFGRDIRIDPIEAQEAAEPASAMPSGRIPAFGGMFKHV